MTKSPCLTCNEEYEAMLEAQAVHREQLRVYRSGLLAPKKAKAKASRASITPKDPL